MDISLMFVRLLQTVTALYFLLGTEGMANTNLACAASGRPGITSNLHGCLEAVEDCVSGYLCERKNADDLYHVMKRFTELSNAQRRTENAWGMCLIRRRLFKKVLRQWKYDFDRNYFIAFSKDR